ncbi:MAG: hypothetical protein JWP91_1435 [Fibrobacteres bacterium]|nr:hypothetical protein [Fibrobacterota bacterium]
MERRGNGMGGRRGFRNYDMEIFLRLAAYRAIHGGRNPPLNSTLWMEHALLWEESHKPTPLGRLFGRRPREADWHDARPLDRFPVVKPFLRDDYTVGQVTARLEAWPMIAGSRIVDRDPSGEWFLFIIEVVAESKRKAEQIVECIFLVEPHVRSNPEPS